MERLLSVSLLAISISVFAQQSPPDDQTDAADAQERQQIPESWMTELPSDQQQDRGQSAPSSARDQRGRASSIDEGAETGGTLAQLVAEHANLSMFVQALWTTGLAEAIANGGYTAFAPTNDAFASADLDMRSLKRPENRAHLVALLRNHLVADEVNEQQARGLDQAVTVAGDTLRLAESHGTFAVNDATVTEADIRVGGSIVHAIDRVLLPASMSITTESQRSTMPGDQISLPVQPRDSRMSQQQGDVPQIAGADRDEHGHADD